MLRCPGRPGVPPPLTKVNSAPNAAPTAACSAPSSAAGTVKAGGAAGRTLSGCCKSSSAQRGVAAKGFHEH